MTAAAAVAAIVCVSSTEVGFLSLLPHLSHSGRDVDPYLRFELQSQKATATTMGTAFEEIKHAVWNEPAAHR